jgi:hypothetical protein
MWLRRLALLAAGAGLTVASAYVWPGWAPAARTGPAGSVEPAAPGPEDPPVVWLDGTLEEASEATLVVRKGEGRPIPIERFAEGATVFLRPVNEGWTELSPAETAAVRAGPEVCVESLLDRGTFFALRVFLGSTCGPAG